MFHRRHFLQTSLTAIASFLLPRSLFASTAAPRFHFIHTDTLTSWPVTDPVTWALKNRGQPILERAAEGLSKLTPSDGDRIVRVVVRRCRLNLLELRPDQVVVQHWGQRQADLRHFFKQQKLARPEIVVMLRDRKKEVVRTQSGDSFLYGSQIVPDFPLDLFVSKFASRFTQEPDDWQAAPNTNSGFAWDGIEDGQIPWTALKSAWRREAPGVCLNCDTPTLLVNFGLRQVGIFNRCPNFLSVCGTCRRSFRDESVVDVGAWIVAHLDAEVRPDAEIIWGRQVKRQ